MIDLDALERDAADPIGHWEDHAPDPAEVLALVRVARAALELCGVESDGHWVVYGDEHGDLIREHLIPALKPFRPGDS